MEPPSIPDSLSSDSSRRPLCPEHVASRQASESLPKTLVSRHFVKILAQNSIEEYDLSTARHMVME